MAIFCKSIRVELILASPHSKSVSNITSNSIILLDQGGPEKYPHIGHAKALLANYELAKQHNGKFVLRFEDTNPRLVKKEFYKIMLENFEWLGVKWDKLDYASDHMEKFYKLCEELIKKDKAYACTCNKEDIRKKRFEKQSRATPNL